ncbi:J domain-containing protein [Novosphingopyxis iocasae]|uniref:J domain-containing protein n=1 Tax=Novosphingopyxis iocasae TaxID=2762729 RepID=UPI001650E024|nr:J domain-containing protein [Novosphingopyxis iocasae]
MGKLLLFAVVAAIIWFWWRGKSERVKHAQSERLDHDDRAVEDAARLLGVDPHADAATIRAAWRREVAAARPDQTNDAASLAALTEARDLLVARATGRSGR